MVSKEGGGGGGGAWPYKRVRSNALRPEASNTHIIASCLATHDTWYSHNT